MNNMKYSKVATYSEFGAVERATKCFFEADQLDEEAYSILNNGPLTCANLDRFTEAKKVADERYVEARRQWSMLKDAQQTTQKPSRFNVSGNTQRSRSPI